MLFSEFGCTVYITGMRCASLYLANSYIVVVLFEALWMHNVFAEFTIPNSCGIIRNSIERTVQIILYRICNHGQPDLKLQYKAPNSLEVDQSKNDSPQSMTQHCSRTQNDIINFIFNEMKIKFLKLIENQSFTHKYKYSYCRCLVANTHTHKHFPLLNV